MDSIRKWVRRLAVLTAVLNAITYKLVSAGVMDQIWSSLIVGVCILTSVGLMLYSLLKDDVAKYRPSRLQGVNGYNDVGID